MSDKKIHIVFQVLNFLHSQHHLAQITTPAEHLLLINLASHQGKKGIYPSISTIAKELKLTRMTVIRALQKWEELEILQIQKNSGKQNYYFLSIPLSTSNIHETSNIHDTSNIDETGLVTFTSSTSNIYDDIDITKEVTKEVTNKSFYKKPVDKSEDQKKYNRENEPFKNTGGSEFNPADLTGGSEFNPVASMPVFIESQPVGQKTAPPVNRTSGYGLLQKKQSTKLLKKNKNNKKLLCERSKKLKPVDNSARHEFADSMDQMACEQRHIDEHEARKKIEKGTPMPDELRILLKRLLV